ncbi:MAG: hypothetical protein ACE1S7_03900 [Candidatus Tisiphia sp.]
MQNQEVQQAAGNDMAVPPPPPPPPLPGQNTILRQAPPPPPSAAGPTISQAQKAAAVAPKGQGEDRGALLDEIRTGGYNLKR